jgi:hypothetical protein
MNHQAKMCSSMNDSNRLEGEERGNIVKQKKRRTGLSV